MGRTPLSNRDRIFVVALAAQVIVAAILGTAIVRAIDRSSQVAGFEGVTGPSPTAEPTGPVAGSRTHATTTTTGGRGAVIRPGDQTQGVTDGVIKVGGLFTLSGPGDATVALHAAQAYFTMVNDAGGVHGRRIEYVTRDDKFDPSIGFTGVKDLVEREKVFAMASWVAPNTENEQTIKYLEQRGIPLIGNFGQPPEFQSPISYSFTANWTTSTRLSVRKVSSTLGMKKIAFIWIHLTDEIDGIIRAAATAEAEANGAEIVYMEAADVAKAVYDDTVISAQQAEATALITVLDAFSLSRYWQSFARTAWRPLQFGYAFAMDPQPTAAIPANYPDVYAMQEMELPGNPTPSVTEYLRTMETYYPDDMDSLSWASELSWLGAKMFVEALRRAGKDPTRQGLLDAMDGMTKFDSGFAPPYTIRPGPHDFVTCMKPAKLTAARRWVQYADWFCL